MKVSNFIFEDEWVSKEYETVTLYYIGSVKELQAKYPEADGFTISLEFPIGKIEPRYASVSISPYEVDMGGCSVTDYDWQDIELPYEEIEKLIGKVGKLNDLCK